MLNYLQAWRERGWSPITSEDYSRAWHRWGGSVSTHPEIVQRLSEFTSTPVKYLSYIKHSEQKTAIAVWGRYIALSKDALKKHNKSNYFDLGKSEVIFPQAANSYVRLKHKANFVSSFHKNNIANLKLHKRGLAMAKNPENYSRKFNYNQRRELRILKEQGGQILPITELSPQSLATMYISLFEKRWQFPAPSKEHLKEVFSLLSDFMTGYFITINEKPAAIQILYKAESPEWISVEYVNGGVDPTFKKLSPGSVLTYVNTQAQWSYAHEQKKQLRYSFGSASSQYKKIWCSTTPIYQIR